jgi:ribosomal protein S18 acetylase RimI-like enzyme
MSKNQINSYNLTTPNATTTIKSAKSILKPHLPLSLPLYRRLQFGRFFAATTILTNLNLNTNTQPPPDSPWLLAFVDRSCRPETEVWFFGSWEAQTQTSIPAETQAAIDELLTNLVQSMKGLGLPTSIHQDLLDAQAAEQLQLEKDHGGFSRNDYGGHAADPNVMLWGAVHEKTVPMPDRLGFLTRRFKAGLVPNYNFIWDVDSLAPVKDLPSGLHWGELTKENFSVVRSRTQIPRQDRTLAVLPNLGLFTESGQLVSWAFVGLDASLTTLHVEPEWRGKGLAKALTTKLFWEKMDLFWEDGMKKLAHGYVIVGNKESEGMCRSLGGKSDWEVYWLRLDLTQVS